MSGPNLDSNDLVGRAALTMLFSWQEGVSNSLDDTFLTLRQRNLSTWDEERTELLSCIYEEAEERQTVSSQVCLELLRHLAGRAEAGSLRVQ